MTDLQFTEKFIAFVDVLGWKSLVRAAEAGQGMTLQELSEIVTALGTEADRKRFEICGPTTCPEAPRIRKDIDFSITSASDSVIISTEISPAGVINLVSHCWTACFKLLSKGILCRGYIKRGKIYHSLEQQIGTGLCDVVEREKKVSVFGSHACERGTPFIEIDRPVLEFVENQSDRCVKEMFSRLVKQDGDLAAIFPFESLNHSFSLGGIGRKFDSERERASLNIVRGWIHMMKEQVQQHIDPSDNDACQKSDHYVRMLDAQLDACAETEKMIDLLIQPHATH